MSSEPRSGGRAEGAIAGRTRSEHSRRLSLLVLVALAAALIAASDRGRELTLVLLSRAEPVIDRHPVAGAILFAALASLSAMLVFFSSALLVPLGVQAWGEIECLLLLWAGWFAGGVLSYLFGRGVGRSLVSRVIDLAKVERYRSRIPPGHSFRNAFLVQMTLPSDVTGYLFGLVDYPFAPFASALLLAELPYAAGTVFLGAAFVRGQTVVLLALAAVGLIALVWYRGRRSRTV